MIPEPETLPVNFFSLGTFLFFDRSSTVYPGQTVPDASVSIPYRAAVLPLYNECFGEVNIPPRVSEG